MRKTVRTIWDSLHVLRHFKKTYMQIKLEFADLSTRCFADQVYVAFEILLGLGVNFAGASQSAGLQGFQGTLHNTKHW